MQILHLAEEGHWKEAQSSGEYCCSTRGASLDEVGFIHASTSSQLPTIAEALYSGVDQLVVLVMDDDAIRSTGIPVRYEDGGDGELYPHIYGSIRPDMVQAVLPGRFDQDGRFAF